MTPENRVANVIQTDVQAAASLVFISWGLRLNTPRSSAKAMMTIAMNIPQSTTLFRLYTDPFPAGEKLHDHGKGHDDHDGEDHQFQIALHPRVFTQHKTEGHQAHHPNHGAEYVVKGEAFHVHLHGAGDNGCESADDGQKSRDGDGESTLVFVKLPCCIDVVFLDQPSVLFSFEQKLEFVPEPIPEKVSEDGRHNEQHHPEREVQQLRFERVVGLVYRGDDHARNEKQGVAGKQKSEKHARFHEQDAQHQVQPTVSHNPIGIEQVFEKFNQSFHGRDVLP